MGIVGRRRAIALAAACGSVMAMASSLAALPAHAQSVPGTAAYLARMDVDGDHRVSLAEYQAWMAYGFDAMDRDHDGVLSAAELPGGRGPALSRAAHRSRLAIVFSRQDRDHNGYLNAQELSAPP